MSANIEVVNNVNTRFTNAGDSDLCMYTDVSTQKIQLGVVLNQPSQMTIMSNLVAVNSKLGVGKSNPSYTLDVAGDVNFSGILRQGGAAYVGSQFTTSNYGVGTSNYVYLNGSNVVIGSNAGFSSNVLTVKGYNS